jgi:tetratricopeptide (TPR) repeat protein
MNLRFFNSNDNQKRLALALMVASFGATSPAVALQIPGMKTNALRPAAPAMRPPATPTAPAIQKAPPTPPPLLPGQVGKDFTECMTIANMTLQKGMSQMAADNYRGAIKFNPNEPAAHIGLANALRGMSTPQQSFEDEAVAEYFEALRLKPDEVRARFGLGTLMMKRERWDEAAGQFLQIIKVAPNDLATRGQLGICYEQKGQTDAALEQFKYIVATEPKNVDGHYNLAVAYDLKEDFRAAAEEYRKVIDLSPKHSLAYVGLGNCLINTRNFKDAISIGQAAVKIDGNPPKNHYALIMLGRAYELSGKEDEAIKIYNRAIQVAPKAPECQKLMQNMLKMRAKKLGLSNLLPGLN